MGVASLLPSRLATWRRVALLLAAVLPAALAYGAADGGVTPAQPAAPAIDQGVEADGVAVDGGDVVAGADVAAARQVALVRLRLPITGNDDAVYQARLQRAVDRLSAGPAGEGDRRPLLV